MENGAGDGPAGGSKYSIVVYVPRCRCVYAQTRRLQWGYWLLEKFPGIYCEISPAPRQYRDLNRLETDNDELHRVSIVIPQDAPPETAENQAL